MENLMELIHRATGNAGQALGPYLIETILQPHEEGRGTAFRVRIESHSKTSISYHKIAEEFYYVLAGNGMAILDGKPFPLKTGDFLRLPPGTTHGFVTKDEP